MSASTIKFQNPIKVLVLKFLFFLLNIKKKLFSPPNVHLGSDLAKRKMIAGIPIFLRHSYSDMVRLREMKKDIYSGNKKFLNQINSDIKPSVLLDFGANIGLSTLALSNKIPSIKTAISVEAEKENYGVLLKNNNEWNKKFSTSFIPVHGIISGSEQLMVQSDNIQKGYSASGTFTFKEVSNKLKNEIINDDKDGVMLSITPGQLLKKYKLEEQLIVCKIDIEGGERGLFEGDTSWLDNVVYLTMEIHDRFSLQTRGSSISFLQAIIKHNFAIVPGIDTLFCYNRNFNFKN